MTKTITNEIINKADNKIVSFSTNSTLTYSVCKVMYFFTYS